jgi:ABC-2 type transport system permease protein
VRFMRPLRVTKRLFRELKNDRRTLALIFVAPLFAMLVFGLAFSGDVSDVTVIVVNQDEGAAAPGGQGDVSLSEKIISNLDPEVLDVKQGDSKSEAVGEVESGNASAVIVFAGDFTADALAGMGDATASEEAVIEVMEDRSNVNVASAITRAVNDALLETMDQVGRKPPITVDTSDAIYGKDASFIDFFVPGIMAFVVYLLTTLLTLITFVSERTTGTLDRIIATPLTAGEIVMGYAIAFSVVGIIQSVILLAVGILVFHVAIVGNVILAFAVVALLAAVSQALGILLSSLARRESQAVQILPFVVLPAFLLSGIFWPLEAIPAWLRPLSYLVPPTYAVDACRSVMLKGWGLSNIWVDVVALLAFAVAFLALAVWTLKLRRE